MKSGAMEVCIVVISGTIRVKSGAFDSGLIGERSNVFDGLPWSVYLPAQSSYSIAATTDCEVAICSAPAKGGLPPRVIGPSDVETLTRGKGTNARHVRNILPETATAESLLVVEVITPGGHWSSYPPHKHDRDALPEESYLEETYYHRLSPRQGFALQRVYTDDRSLDETLAVGDRDVVLVPRGYHPVGAPHGYDLYYLNVMAGPKRTWRFHNDPDHQWMLG
jgi:5-deoxy-glucuronate isomerase